ncbi:MAG: hypothetical protein RL497_253 [Pseudomonadota bacterium]|jgi:hypothetical protein
MTVPFASWLDDSHRDQLKELVNLAMGDGAKALSAVTQCFIQLSVPQVNQVSIQDLNKHCKFVRSDAFCCCVQEYAALGQVGWLFIAIDPKSLATYASLLDRDCVDTEDHENMLVQLAGVLVPVILPRIAKELRVSLKLGEVQPFVGLSELPSVGGNANANTNVNAVNLAFSYAVEAPIKEGELQEGKLPVLMAFDVVMRAPADMVKQLAEKFASRLDILL